MVETRIGPARRARPSPGYPLALILLSMRRLRKVGVGVCSFVGGLPHALVYTVVSGFRPDAVSHI